MTYTHSESLLLRNLPLGSLSVEERRIQIYDAIDEIYKPWLLDPDKFSLDDSTSGLVRGIIAWLVYEYLSDVSISEAMGGGWMYRKTLVSEWEPSIPMAEVSSNPPDEAQGLGVAVKKVDQIPFSKPLLEELLMMLLKDNPGNLLKVLKDVDDLGYRARKKSFGQPSKFSPRRAILKAMLPYIESAHGSSMLGTLQKRYPLSIYRLFVHLRPTVTLWEAAWQRFLSSPFSTYDDIGYALLLVAPPESVRSVEMNWSSRDVNIHRVLGKRGQLDDTIVTTLLDDLAASEDSPGKCMDIIHAILIAACKNPRAVEAYAEIRGNRLKYPHAVVDEDVLRMGRWLDPLLDSISTTALKQIIKTWTNSTETPPDGLIGQSRTYAQSMKEIIKNAPKLDPDAQEFLNEHVQVADDASTSDVALMHTAVIAMTIQSMLMANGKWEEPGVSIRNNKPEVSIRNNREHRNARYITLPTSRYCVDYMLGTPKFPLGAYGIPPEEEWILDLELAGYSNSDVHIWAADRETSDYLLTELRPKPKSEQSGTGILERLEESGREHSSLRDGRAGYANAFISRAVLGASHVSVEDVRRIVDHYHNTKKIDDWLRTYMITAFDRIGSKSSEAALAALDNLPALLADKSHFTIVATLQAINHCIDVLGGPIPPATRDRLITSINEHCTKPGFRKYLSTGELAELKGTRVQDLTQVVLRKLRQ